MTEVRDYRTERMNRARLWRELSRALRSAITVAVAMILGLAITLSIAHRIGSSIGLATQSVTFAVNNANDVVAQSDEVRYLGIPVGRITSVRLDGTQPVITAQLQTRYGKVYRNARAVVRPNTALADMYLDIVYPGTPSAGLARPSQPLPTTQTDTSVNIDDVLDVFNTDARASLHSLLDNLGNGLRDRGASLREGFVELTPFLQVAGRLSRQLAVRATLVRQLVHNAAILTSALGQRQLQLRELVSAGSATMTTLENGSQNLNATLQQLPPTLTSLHSSLAAVSGVLGDVNQALQSLYPVADLLPASLAAVRRLSASASPAVRALQQPVQQLVPLAQHLVPLAAHLSDTVSALTPQVSTIDRATADLAGCRTGVQGFFQWNPSLTKYGDDRGQSPRGNAAIGLQASGVLNDPFEYAPQACTPGKVVGGRVPTPADEH